MKAKYPILIILILFLLFSCDLFNPGSGTGTLIFKGVEELPALSKSLANTGKTDLHEMYMSGMEFDIHELWISKSLVEEDSTDDFEWHLIGGDQGLIPMEEHEFTANDVPAGNYKSLKIVFRNRVKRLGVYTADTSHTVEYPSSLNEESEGDSSFVINYFSSNGSFVHNTEGFQLMSDGENMPSFNINAGRTTWIYWKGGGEESEFTDFTFDWLDIDNDSLWTPGVDSVGNFNGPEDIPMWTFMVVEE